jgi:hypothetical protein
MPSTPWNTGVIALGVLGTLAMLTGCPGGPEDCGKNVSKVVGISFSGPSVLPVAPNDVRFAGYAVTMTIERKQESEIAITCFAVRDEDPFYKLFWAVDDVLAAGFMTFPVGVNSRTMEGHFSLYKPQGDDDVCGAGNPSTSDGCSDESEAEVYLQTVNASGPTSPKTPIQKIRVP